jgi:hypothetical protein
MIPLVPDADDLATCGLVVGMIFRPYRGELAAATGQLQWRETRLSRESRRANAECAGTPVEQVLETELALAMHYAQAVLLGHDHDEGRQREERSLTRAEGREARDLLWQLNTTSAGSNLLVVAPEVLRVVVIAQFMFDPLGLAELATQQLQKRAASRR